MMANKTEQQNSLYGVIIKVENLNASRSFYRDVLDLGAPVMDSNFWVEFKINCSSSLILEEAAQGEKLPAGRGRISWACSVKNLETVVARLEKNGFKPVAEEETRLGMKILKYCDPEGNPFILCQEK